MSVALKNDLQRFGIERILHSLDTVGRIRLLTSANEATTTGGAAGLRVLILALWEVPDAGRVPLQSPGTKILFLMDSSNPHHVVDAATAGGNGFLDVRQLNGRTLGDALNRVRCGEVPMPAQLAHDLLAKVRDSSEADRTGYSKQITPREHQVLGLLVEGLSNKQIARRLGISEHGVKRLVASILAKLNCTNRTQAVVKAIRDELCAQVAISAAPPR
ncbi:response regulator transcription factor [Saccharothrix sp. 6-C]|uniref:response regulator transcription factor n=1 Tax=Saccharothrix sp. 6-C TaxID=2781735 RepID=UPI001916FBBF|nr:response regulator transcription factor [Saccharothrix sp. 6-C]QQQ79545.1 response regulator transcription factor [Saccharothrix sp. 6-C]